MCTPDPEDAAQTPLLGPDVKYAQLADSHTHTPWSWGLCSVQTNDVLWIIHILRNHFHNLCPPTLNYP